MAKDNSGFFKVKNSWSEVKDNLLGCYLVPYFQKILRTGKPVLYVDCFAGKGVFEDGKKGSPVIALDARDRSLGQARILSVNNRIDSCFIELNHSDVLADNVSCYNNDICCVSVVAGRYEDNIEYILNNAIGYNVFLYIDPYGIRALDAAMFDRFAGYGFNSIEMLINFNSFGFFRDACRVMKVNCSCDDVFNGLEELVEYDPTVFDSGSGSYDLLSSIAGGDYWKGIVLDYNRKEINGREAERRLSLEYKKRLRKCFNYVLDMPIRLKSGSQPKYRMIHVSNHEAGCCLMANNMLKRKGELVFDVQKSVQGSLLDYTPNFASGVEGDYVPIGYIRDRMKQYVAGINGGVGLTKFLAGFIGEYGILCDFKHLHGVIDELCDQKMIDIERTPAVTGTGRKTTFWEEKGGQKVVLRRCF
ncbi:three-Cys-motif partner protein TcmP [Desulfovibrio subterraneus]|uniref:three-Cys-motif partner protein TcmP n=1 Tax=Desulfovibrio subterraneus TaxID=2718620 RepID=UPI0022B86456|nr:three-Cys-motif partner protein TcmP [Desulfovibrio subterraneus]WBF66435.1 three-Cys-motif partner protein TcmP [Desulfovibrio subterraneus]